MKSNKDYSQIATIKGIDQYLILNNKGTILFQAAENHESLAELTAQCISTVSQEKSLGLKFIVFNQNNDSNLILFEHNSLLVGVTQKTANDASELIKEIKTLL